MKRYAMSYGCIPYVMRYKDYEISPYRGVYITVARWCNQISFFKKKSFREFVALVQSDIKSKCAAAKALEQVESDFPDIASKYFDIHFSDFDQNGNKIKD